MDIQAFETLKNEALSCQKCELCKTRTNVVFGAGTPQTPVLFVGEGRAKTKICKAKPL